MDDGGNVKTVLFYYKLSLGLNIGNKNEEIIVYIIKCWFKIFSRNFLLSKK
jgi:hypothetical protein